MFMLLMDVGIFVAVVGFVVWCFSKTSFSRIFKAGKSQVNRVGRFVESADPLSNLQRAVDEGMEKIEESKKGLEETRAFVLRVKRELAGLQTEKTRLTHRIQVAVDSGDPNNTAKNNALLLASADKRITQKEADLARYEGIYQNFLERLQYSHRMLTEARERASHLGARLAQSVQEKRLNEFARSMEFNPNGIGSDLQEAEELIQRQIDQNQAAGELLDEFAPTSTGDEEDDKLLLEAEADEILKKFAPTKAAQ